MGDAERAYEERRPQFIHFAAYPAFDGLRSDPRYDRLIERIGLAPEPPTRLERLAPDVLPEGLLISL